MFRVKKVGRTWTVQYIPTGVTLVHKRTYEEALAVAASLAGFKKEETYGKAGV